MAPVQSLKMFEDSRIRAVWDEQAEEWFFSVVDVVAVLSDSNNPKRYWSDLKRKMQSEGSQAYDEIVRLKMKASDGKSRLTDAASTAQVLRIIQSIPSPKAEPFKLWLAQMGAERIEETVDPEQAIDRALETYLKKGYSADWVNQRLQAISVRKELTDEWTARGMSRGSEFAILTDEISKAWSGMSTRQYKNHKGLTKESLRDNMSTLELVLNMLAEATTTELSKQEEPDTFDKSKSVALRGGAVAGHARQEIESQTGVPVITSKNAQDFRLLSEVIEAAAEEVERGRPDGEASGGGNSEQRS